MTDILSERDENGVFCWRANLCPWVERWTIKESRVRVLFMDSKPPESREAPAPASATTERSEVPTLKFKAKVNIVCSGCNGLRVSYWATSGKPFTCPLCTCGVTHFRDNAGLPLTCWRHKDHEGLHSDEGKPPNNIVKVGAAESHSTKARSPGGTLIIKIGSDFQVEIDKHESIWFTSSHKDGDVGISPGRLGLNRFGDEREVLTLAFKLLEHALNHSNWLADELKAIARQ